MGWLEPVAGPLGGFHPPRQAAAAASAVALPKRIREESKMQRGPFLGRFGAFCQGMLGQLFAN